MSQLLEELRAAIETDGRTRYRLSKDCGVGQSQLGRLVAGKELTLPALEAIAVALGFEIGLRLKAQGTTPRKTVAGRKKTSTKKRVSKQLKSE